MVIHMSNRKSGVILSYICIFVKLVVGLLLVPILLGSLSDSEYGLYQLMGSLISYLSVMDFGLSATVIRYYTIYRTNKSKRDAENVLGIARNIYFIISIITLIVCGILLTLIDPLFRNSLTTYELCEAKRIFVVLSINVIVSLMTNVYIAILNSHEKFILIKSLDILNSILQLLFAKIAMKIAPTALSVAIMLMIINVITAAIKVYYSKFKLGVRVKYYYRDKELVKNMLTFSASVFVVSIVDMIYWKTDQIILGAVSGTLAVAIYGVASQIYWNYMPLSTAIQSVFLPSVTERISKGASDKELSDLFIRVGRIQFLILGCVLSCFALVGRTFIIILAGESYIDAFWICIIIMVPFTIDLIQNMGINIMQAKNKYSFRAKVYSVSAACNIILTLMLAKPFSGVGCALASAICMICSNGIVMNWYYAKRLNINIRFFWENIFSIALLDIVIVLLLSIAFSIYSFQNIYIDFFVKAVVFLALYILLVYKFAMNSYEKNLIQKIALLLKIEVKRR